MDIIGYLRTIWDNSRNLWDNGYEYFVIMLIIMIIATWIMAILAIIFFKRKNNEFPDKNTGTPKISENGGSDHE